MEETGSSSPRSSQERRGLHPRRMERTEQKPRVRGAHFERNGGMERPIRSLANGQVINLPNDLETQNRPSRFKRIFNVVLSNGHH